MAKMAAWVSRIDLPSWLHGQTGWPSQERLHHLWLPEMMWLHDHEVKGPQTPSSCTALQRVRYDPALALIVDIRTVLPGSGATAPVGWAALPIFESGPGRYVASGYYQLPLFQVSNCWQHCCL